MSVSVIIPTFNRSAMLREAVESVCMQDYSSKEIIIVDDGSTDDTEDMISRFQPGIIYIRVQNGGVSRARNIGIRRSSGELIAFLDSDDLWLPGKLKRQVEYFQKNPDIHLCQTEEIWVRNGKRVNSKSIHKKYSGSPSAVMIRRRVFDDIGLFDEDMPACEDYDLWLRAALKYQIVTLPDALIVKRGGHEDQLSRQWGLDIWRIHALEKLLVDEAVDQKLRSLIINDLSRRACIVASGAEKRGKKSVSERYKKLSEMYSSQSG
jgi:glycosyltransferase involved in cell wall biosynthesis